MACPVGNAVDTRVDRPTRAAPTVCDICTFAVLFSVSGPFYASHVFMRGTLCCVINRNFK